MPEECKHWSPFDLEWKNVISKYTVCLCPRIFLTCTWSFSRWTTSIWGQLQILWNWIIYMTLVTKKALHTCNRLYLRMTCLRISSLLTCFCDVESQRVQDQFPDKMLSNMNVLESKQLQWNPLFPCKYRHKNSEFFLKGGLNMHTCISIPRHFLPPTSSPATSPAPHLSKSVWNPHKLKWRGTYDLLQVTHQIFLPYLLALLFHLNITQCMVHNYDSVAAEVCKLCHHKVCAK